MTRIRLQLLASVPASERGTSHSDVYLHPGWLGSGDLKKNPTKICLPYCFPKAQVVREAAVCAWGALGAAGFMSVQGVSSERRREVVRGYCSPEPLPATL